LLGTADKEGCDGKGLWKDSLLLCVLALGEKCLSLSLIYVYCIFWLRLTRLCACVVGAHSRNLSIFRLTDGDRVRLRSLPALDTEARQQKGEEGDATPDLVLKHPDATIATYV
jgi:hypothetical protein